VAHPIPAIGGDNSNVVSDELLHILPEGEYVENHM
jgi:hypothetical protein